MVVFLGNGFQTSIGEFGELAVGLMKSQTLTAALYTKQHFYSAEAGFVAWLRVCGIFKLLPALQSH